MCQYLIIVNIDHQLIIIGAFVMKPMEPEKMSDSEGLGILQ